jgi:hypothetical protein
MYHPPVVFRRRLQVSLRLILPKWVGPNWC